MTVNVGFANILVYLLVWVRLAAMFLFNPLLSRNSVPMRVRVGLCLMLTLMLAPMQPEHVFTNVYSMNVFMLAFSILREVAVGFVYGYVFQIFYYFLFFVGDLVDTDIGLSMAKSFDPATSIQTGFSSSMFTILFSIYVFATGGHLAMIRIFADSFAAIEVGSFTLTTSVITFVLQLLTQVFSLALRLMAPFMVAEFILQVGMGVLMRFIPQLSIFAINFPLRIILGVLLLYMFAPYIGQFVDTYIDATLNSLVQATVAMGG